MKIEDKKLRVDIGWLIGTDGTAYVQIPEGVPAGNWSPDEIDLLAKSLTLSAQRAREMREAWQWLTDAELSKDEVNRLIMRLNEAKDKDAMREALRGLGSVLSGGI